MSASLLDPAFTRELEALRRQLRVRARSGSGGDHVASRRGSSAEFLEHRPYAPGDDLRRMDWLAFARTGEPVLKLFRAEEDVVVRLVLDASASLDAGEPSKMLVCKRMAAAIAYMALASSERAQVLAAAGGELAMRDPARGRGALAKVLRELDAIVPGRGTDLASAIDSAVLRSPRPGMLVVVSDFLDAGPFDTALGRAASAGHDLALVQVLSREEVDPPWEGDLALEDAETGEAIDVTVDARAVEAYLARLGGLVVLLRSVAKRHRATFVRLTAGDPLLDAARRFVARSID
ncbi:MAG TPA: DUF58 domain-containing protein [Polyangiaceae bacterium]|jgi:uncharacterized protein (DUF58 family)